MTQPIGVCVLLIKNNQVLLGKRKNSYKAGWFGLPGGRLELSESLIACAQREVREETDLKITESNLEYVGAVRDLQSDYNFIHFVFACRDFTGEPKLTEPDKCEGWEWFSLDSLPDSILPGHVAGLKIYTHPNTPRYQDLY